MLTSFALNCTLKREGPSSTDSMIGLIAEALRARGVEHLGTERVADLNILPGVTSDEGDGDEWPGLRQQILAADIFVLATPIWLGQPSSVCKRVLERMDAFLGETDAAGRMPSFSKVAVVGVVGNEDGAHHVCAELFQALNDVGWTIPAGAGVYWVGEAMQKTDFRDLKSVPENVVSSANMLAANAAHLARLLKERNYPGAPG